MLQKNSSPLFSKPTIYFGSYQNMEEEIFGNEVDLEDPWSLSLEKELVFSLRQNIGIFIHWSDLTEIQCEDSN